MTFNHNNYYSMVPFLMGPLLNNYDALLRCLLLNKPAIFMLYQQLDLLNANLAS